MAAKSLREELEAVWKANYAALKKRDFDRFAATLYAGDQAPSEEAREQFSEGAHVLLELIPDPSETSFVAIKTEGDDLAGYYCIRKDPDFVNVFLTKFVKVGGQWKVALESSSYSFEPKEGEDIVAKAKHLIETDKTLRLERPEPAAIGEAANLSPGSAEEDDGLMAALNCMGYDYEVKIAVNGEPIPGITGGCSQGCRLCAVGKGIRDIAPGVLHAGKNQIEVEYRRTKPGDQWGPGLTVEIYVLRDRLAFRLQTRMRPSGKVAATFTMPASESDEVPLVDIDDDKT